MSVDAQETCVSRGPADAVVEWAKAIIKFVRKRSKWRHLKAAQSSRIGTLAIAYPIVGYFLLFNGHIRSVFDDVVIFSRKPDAPNPYEVPHLTFDDVALAIYLGLLFLSVAFLVVRVFIPNRVRYFDDHVDLFRFYGKGGSSRKIAFLSDAAALSIKEIAAKGWKDQFDNFRVDPKAAPNAPDAAQSNYMLNAFRAAKLDGDKVAINTVVKSAKNDKEIMDIYFDMLDRTNRGARAVAFTLYYLGMALLAIVSLNGVWRVLAESYVRIFLTPN